MTLPSPIGSAVFTDGELTNETKWYTRVFSVINQLIAYNQAQAGAQRAYTALRGNPPNTSNFASGSFFTVLSLGLPTGAARGSYFLSAHLDLGTDTTTTAALRIIMPDASTYDRVYNPVTSGLRTQLDFSAPFSWPGGAGIAQMQVSLGSGVGTIVNTITRLDAFYIGP